MSGYHPRNPALYRLGPPRLLPLRGIRIWCSYSGAASCKETYLHASHPPTLLGFRVHIHVTIVHIWYYWYDIAFSYFPKTATIMKLHRYPLSCLYWQAIPTLCVCTVMHVEMSCDFM